MSAGSQSKRQQWASRPELQRSTTTTGPLHPMTTTQQPWSIPVEAIIWGWAERDEAYHVLLQPTYGSHVVSLADYQSVELSDKWLSWLFEQHGADLSEYVCEASKATFAGLAVKPVNHAGQALCWLGY